MRKKGLVKEAQLMALGWSIPDSGYCPLQALVHCSSSPSLTLVILLLSWHSWAVFPKTSVPLSSIYVDCILLCGLSLMSHTCRGESSLSKKEYLVAIQVLDKMHEKAQDFKAMCLSKLGKFVPSWIPQRPNVSGYILSVAAGSWSCVLCPGPRAHLHLLLTRRTCLKPVGVSFCAGKLIS